MKSINKKLRIFGNKRGEDMLVDFWSILIFALIILLFFILFAFKSSDKGAVEKEFAQKDANFMLQSYLRAPAISVNEPDKTIADIITEDVAKDDFRRITMLTDDFFKHTTLVGEETIFEMNIYIKDDNNKNLKNLHPISMTKKGNARKSSVKTYIPGYESKISVELEIWSTYNPHK
jgi:hypothetical protein